MIEQEQEQESERLDANEAFDTAEGLSILAHDYGLYAVIDALRHRVGFSAGASRDTLDGIDEAGRDVYEAHESEAAATVDVYAVPPWAERLLRSIETASEAP